MTRSITKIDYEVYLQPKYLPEVSTIVGVAENKCPTIRKIMDASSAKTAKQMVFMAIMQYVSEDLLPLSSTHTTMITDWIVSDYNPETNTGGVLGYSIEDIHLVFRMGLRGEFGKPVGHKFIMTDIIGKKGWFDQYHDIRNIEMGSYYWQKNKAPSLDVPKDHKPIACPPELSHKMYLIGTEKKHKKIYKSVQEWCDDTGRDYKEYILPYFERWNSQHKNLIEPYQTERKDDRGNTIPKITAEDHCFSQLKNLLYQINKGNIS